jgi:hypothetical protein
MPAFVLPIQIVTSVLCWIRLLARFQQRGGHFGIDDVLVTLAWILGCGVSAAVLLSKSILNARLNATDYQPATYRYGFNRHVWDVPAKLYPGGALV